MTKQRIKIIFITCATMLLAIIIIAGFLFLSLFYQQIYSTPKMHGGVMDFSTVDMKERNVDAIMEGEWEFYKNKWIVTDNITAVPDDKINLPGRWKSGAGYGSYRMKVVGVSEGEELYILLHNFTVPFRAFINGQLNSCNGEVLKDKEGVSFGRTKLVENYKVRANETLDIVLEVSYNNQGGIYKPPWLNFKKTVVNPTSVFISFAAYFSLGAMAVLLLFSFIVNLGLYRQKIKYTSFILLIFVLIHLLLSKEVFSQLSMNISLNYYLVQIFSCISGFLMLYSLVFHLHKTRIIEISPKLLLPFIASSLVCVTGFFLLYHSMFVVFPLILLCVQMTYVFYLLVKAACQKAKFAISYLAMLFTQFAIFCIEVMDYTGIIIYGTESIFAVVLMIIIILETIIYYKRIRESNIDAVQGLKYHQDAIESKQLFLNSQVKPHFIFNTLTAIQFSYHKSKDKGDEMLDKFATHLRNNINVNNKLIPFMNEINNVTDYFDLENYRFNNSLVLLLNTQVTDFCIPPLSLQPLIENAVKHSKINAKTDGFIEIKSKKTKDYIIITVTDNGEGFDINKIKSGGIGLKNVSERLSLALNAKMEIKSIIGKGTKIIIKIPLNKNVL